MIIPRHHIKKKQNKTKQNKTKQKQLFRQEIKDEAGKRSSDKQKVNF